MLNVVSVLTFKSVETILRSGGTQSWALDPDRARACKYVKICRNAKTRDTEGPEPHGSAFLIGKVSGVVPSTDTVGRWMITISDYATVDWPNQWSGRNPVSYFNTGDPITISHFENLTFVPLPKVPASSGPEKFIVTLPAALEGWIHEQVASGKYIDASDYVRDLVRRDRVEAMMLCDANSDAMGT